MTEDVFEVRRVHEEINLFLIEHIPGASFQAVTLLKTGQPSAGRTGTDAAPGRNELIEAFRASGRAVEGRLARLVENRGRIKERPGLVLPGYLIAHESHHRGPESGSTGSAPSSN